jgi:transcriptional regulator GlxA family with amidase domain
MKGTVLPFHVSLVAFADAVISTLTGIYDVMNAFDMLAGADDTIPADPPFVVEIVGCERGPVVLASGMPLEVHRSVGEIRSSDVVIVPSVLLGQHGWQPGRYPKLVDWASRMHDAGALLCSACSGVFLLAETGLFDGKETNYPLGLRGTIPKHLSTRTSLSRTCSRRFRGEAAAGIVRRFDDLA